MKFEWSRSLHDLGMKTSMNCKTFQCVPAYEGCSTGGYLRVTLEKGEGRASNLSRESAVNAWFEAKDAPILPKPADRTKTTKDEFIQSIKDHLKYANVYEDYVPGEAEIIELYYLYGGDEAYGRYKDN